MQFAASREREGRERVLYDKLKEAIEDKDGNRIKYIANLFKQEKFDINKSYINGNTPLIYAITLNEPQICSTLMRFGASTRSKNVSGDLPLNIAVERELEGVVRVLLENSRADLLDKSSFGKGAIHIAAEIGSVKMLDMLLEYWYKFSDEYGDVYEMLDMQDGDKNTPLHIAVYYNNEEMVQRLLTLIVNLTIKNRFGKTALDAAEKNEALSELVRWKGEELKGIS